MHWGRVETKFIPKMYPPNNFSNNKIPPKKKKNVFDALGSNAYIIFKCSSKKIILNMFNNNLFNSFLLLHKNNYLKSIKFITIFNFFIVIHLRCKIWF